MILPNLVGSPPCLILDFNVALNRYAVLADFLRASPQARVKIEELFGD